MTNVVQLTIDLGGRFISRHQQIHGTIIEENNDYIIFKDLQEDDEPPRKIRKQTITSIDKNVNEPNTTPVEGG
jgi:hypothetical protein